MDGLDETNSSERLLMIVEPLPRIGAKEVELNQRLIAEAAQSNVRPEPISRRR